MQHGLVRPVRERHAVDVDLARTGQVDRGLALADGRARVEHAEDLAERRGRRLHRVVELAELVDRLEEAVQPQHERGDGADGHDTTRREPTAVPDDHRGARDTRVLDDREVLRRDANGVHVRVVLVFVRAVELAGERLFAPERLHHPHPFEALLQRAEVRRDAVAHLEVRLVGDPAEPPAPEVDGRDDHEDARTRAARTR